MEFVFAILFTSRESLRRREFQMLFCTRKPALYTYCAGTCYSTKTFGKVLHSIHNIITGGTVCSQKDILLFYYGAGGKRHSGKISFWRRKPNWFSHSACPRNGYYLGYLW